MAPHCQSISRACAGVAVLPNQRRHRTHTVSVKACKEPPPTPAPRTAGAASAAVSTTNPSTTAPTLGVTAVAPNGRRTTTHADLAASHAAGQQHMSWTKQWWPIAVEEYLHTSLPTPVTLMGKNLVLLRTADSAWSCFDSACHHRGAAEDQGSLQANILQSSDHRRQFEAGGSVSLQECKNTPQSDKPRKDCLPTGDQAGAYPVRAAQGLLWVWGECGAAAAEEAAAAPLKADPDVDDPDKYIWRFPWLDREAMVSYEYGLDNMFDVTHAPFAHDGMLGITAASNTPDPPATVHETAQGMTLLTVPSDVPAKGNNVGPAVRVTLIHPVLGQAETFVADPEGKRIQDLVKLVVYRTPVSPGVSKVFCNMLLSTKMDPQQRQSLMSTPAWDLHARMLRFFDGDIVLLHDQERLVASNGGWRKAMFMPHPSDRGIAQFRAWFDRVGPIPYSEDMALGPIQPRQVILNHYEQHCKTCKTCQEGLRLLKRLEYGCYITAALTSIVSLKFAELAPVGTTAEDLTSFLAPYFGLAAAAALLVSGLKAKQYVQDNFYFKDYVQSRSGR